jgi:hypothetical protein
LKIVLKIILKEKKNQKKKKMRTKEEDEEESEERRVFSSVLRGGFWFCGVWETGFGSARFWSGNLMLSLLPFGDVAAEKENFFHGSFVARSEL